MKKTLVSFIAICAVIFAAGIAHAETVTFDYSVGAKITNYDLKDGRSEKTFWGYSYGEKGQSDKNKQNWIAADGGIRAADGKTYDAWRSIYKNSSSLYKETAENGMSDKMYWGTKEMTGIHYGKRDEESGLYNMENGTAKWDPNKDVLKAHSSFEVIGQGGNYIPGSDPTEALLMKHDNQTIDTRSATPDYFEITLDVVIEKLIDGVGMARASTELVLQLGFCETLNEGEFQDDVFYLLDNPFSKGYGYGELKFEDGSLYYVSLYGSFGTLDYENDYDYYMVAYNDMIERGINIKEGDDIYGWITKENQSTPNEFLLSIEILKTPPVDPNTVTPEPATLLFLGLGALGLPVARRLRKK